MTTADVSVFVPAADTMIARMVAPGSGIVARPTGATTHPDTPTGGPGATPLVLADYEGNVHGSQNLTRYADRVLHAHGRASQDYPTIARSLVPAGDLIRVGYFDIVSGEIHLDPEHRDTVAAWLGADDIDWDVELRCSGARYESRRSIIAARATGDPAQIFAANQLARRLNIDV